MKAVLFGFTVPLCSFPWFEKRPLRGSILFGGVFPFCLGECKGLEAMLLMFGKLRVELGFCCARVAGLAFGVCDLGRGVQGLRRFRFLDAGLEVV